ncbi:MAG: UvrD-helicase domain-containing protein, partial [Bacteroidetes bacterium]|nr:UvrD-helicase domain-containing protein [Bacteroidota bacterium]
MSSPYTYQPFDAAAVPLRESNLIEASAGTGKTYSIAILALRLVLEQNLSVKEILMVTFTKAAVAELEERIRLFTRTAWKCANGKEIADSNIRGLVERAVAQLGNEEVEARLKDAVVLLDELSVRTIHGFCQQTLNEFAFETNQLFGADMLPDISVIIGEELNKFWRTHITTLDEALLRRIWTKDMREDMHRLVKEHLEGKKYMGFDPRQDYRISNATQQEWLKQLKSFPEEEEKLQQALYAFIDTEKERLRAACEKNTHARKGLLPLLDNAEAFADAVSKKKSSAYIGTLFPDILERLEAIAELNEAYRKVIQAIRVQLNCLAILEVSLGVQHYKEHNNQLGYDDLIDNLHRAITRPGSGPLIKGLQKKYKAVFIDEFQDTDRKQYEIFSSAFGAGTILFYIGDPKQSIYAWRKADIFTYFKARKEVLHRYEMNTNYRSSHAMIAAMNHFFLPLPGFDTFFFGGEEETIQYIPVESPKADARAIWKRDGKEETPLSVYQCTSPKE